MRSRYVPLIFAAALGMSCNRQINGNVQPETEHGLIVPPILSPEVIEVTVDDLLKAYGQNPTVADFRYRHRMLHVLGTGKLTLDKEGTFLEMPRQPRVDFNYAALAAALTPGLWARPQMVWVMDSLTPLSAIILFVPFEQEKMVKHSLARGRLVWMEGRILGLSCWDPDSGVSGGRTLRLLKCRFLMEGTREQWQQIHGANTSS